MARLSKWHDLTLDYDADAGWSMRLDLDTIDPWIQPRAIIFSAPGGQGCHALVRTTKVAEEPYWKWERYEGKSVTEMFKNVDALLMQYGHELTKERVLESWEIFDHILMLCADDRLYQKASEMVSHIFDEESEQENASV